MTNGKLYTA